MKLTSEERAYLAGFWDGEGSFTLARKKKKEWYYYQPCVQVGLTHKPTLERISEMTGKGFIFDLHKPHQNHKQAYKLQITGMENILEFIEAVEPYLITKKAVALILKEYCVSRKGKMHLPRNKRGSTKNEHLLFNKMTVLNKRGVD